MIKLHAKKSLLICSIPMLCIVVCEVIDAGKLIINFVVRFGSNRSQKALNVTNYLLQVPLVMT